LAWVVDLKETCFDGTRLRMIFPLKNRKSSIAMSTTVAIMYLGLVKLKNSAFGISKSIRVASNGRSQVRELSFCKNRQVHGTLWRPTADTLKIMNIDVIRRTFDRVPKTVLATADHTR
jgi:hypothetical protein